MEEKNILEIEAEKLTVNQLKAILSRENVELPTSKVNKQEYVKLFHNLQEKKRKSTNEMKENSKKKKKKENKNDINLKETNDNDIKKKSNKNIFQKNSSIENEEEINSKKKKQRKSIASSKIDFKMFFFTINIKILILI